MNKIGIIGAGEQAQWQIRALKAYLPKAEIFIWCRNAAKANNLDATYLESVESLVNSTDVTITTTPSTTPIMLDKHYKKDLVVIGIGSDDNIKNEIDANLFSRVRNIIVDSLSQAQKMGDSYHALQNGSIDKSNLVEFGQILAEDRKLDGPTIFDFTGIAAQDVAIAELIAGN